MRSPESLRPLCRVCVSAALPPATSNHVCHLPPSGDGWIHEIKHDGFRIMARRDGAAVRLITRHGNDFIHRFPLAVAAVTALPSARFWRSHRHQLRRSAEAALPPKVVQALLGHASIVMTLDTYGHLFPRGDDGAELATAEKALLA